MCVLEGGVRGGTVCVLKRGASKATRRDSMTHIQQSCTFTALN